MKKENSQITKVKKSIVLLYLFFFIYTTIGFYFPSQHSHSVLEDIEAHHEESFNTEITTSESDDHEVCSFKTWALNFSQEFLFVFNTSVFRYLIEKQLNLYTIIASQAEAKHIKSRAPPSCFL